MTFKKETPLILKAMMQAIIHCWLDYCNAPLVGAAHDEMKLSSSSSSDIYCTRKVCNLIA